MALTPAEKQRAYRDRLKQRAAGQLPAAPILTNIPPERRWKALQEQARNALQTMIEEMEAYRDERSETWQESERGESFQERIEALESVITELDELPGA
jgi:histidinol dehydrogenase